MKISRFLLLLLVAAFLLLSNRGRTQTLTTLHNFSSSSDVWDRLLLLDNTLYGTTSGGLGSIFSIGVDGSGYTTLYSFDCCTGVPRAGLISSSNFLYGTFSYPNGGILRIETNGTGFTNLHNFVGGPNDGRNAQGELVMSEGMLFGSTDDGGPSDTGTLFRMNIDGTGYTNLHVFPSLGFQLVRHIPGFVLSEGVLYGVTHNGGTFGRGTIFRMNTNGLGFTNLHNFTEISGPLSTNKDGIKPYGGIIFSSNVLYGCAREGGAFGKGTVFAINTDGTEFRILHAFNGIDGNDSRGKLALSGNMLYGATIQGGAPTNGTIFSINTDGSDFQILYTFPAGVGTFTSLTNNGGAHPTGGVMVSGNKLYGTTIDGGTFGNGTIFSLTLPPPTLKVVLSGLDVVLSWPTNSSGFTLQSTTNLVSSTIWDTNLPSPVVVNGQNTVTNTVSGLQRLHRLNL